MKRKEAKLLLELGFNKKEIIYLKTKKCILVGTNLEELIILLGSLNIQNIHKFLLDNNYLINCNILDLAFLISETIKKTKDYNKTKEYLLETKFAIIE